MDLRITSVNVLIRDKAGRTFLQMRDGKARTEPLTWSFWGGAVDPSDANVESCAARELLEELGVAASPDQFRRLAERVGGDGQIAPLLLFLPPISWPEVSINEGAGAAFFWRSEIEAIPVSKSVGWYLRNRPEFLHAAGAPRGQTS